MADKSNAVVSSETLNVITKAEFDVQIATAHKYPRSVKEFRDKVLQLVTLNEQVASECSYALPRKDKDGKTVVIEGASIRFAEIIGSCWRNAHAATRIVNDDGEFVTAQAVFHDLEGNWKIVEEVQRRVTDRRGNRYSSDMVAVTSNAARSIALRNAILHGIPKAFWEDLRQRARMVALGDVRSLTNKRNEAVKAFVAYGVTEEQILSLLQRKGLEDVTIEDLGTLHGILTAIKDGDTTPEEAFALRGAEAPAPSAIQTLNEAKPEAVGEAPTADSATPPPSGSSLTYAQLADDILKCESSAQLDKLIPEVGSFPEDQQAELRDLLRSKASELISTAKKK